LLLLNGIAALMIGFHHGAAYTVSIMIGWTEGFGGVELANASPLDVFTYYLILAVRQLDSFGVPAFLFVSGFFVSFLAARGKTQLRLEMLMPRIKVLLIPFALWTAIRMVMVRQFEFDLPSLVSNVLDMYYYIPLLIQLYVLAPLLVPLARNNWRLLLLLAAFLQYGAEAVRYLQAVEVNGPVIGFLIDVTPRWFFPTHIFYFALGIVFGVHITAASKWLTAHKWHLLIFIVAAVSLTIVEHKLVATLMGREWMGRTFDTFSRLTYAATFSLCFVAFHETPLPYAKQLVDIGARSLGIYLMNTPVIYIAGLFFFHFTPWLLDIPLLYFVIQTVLGVAAPLLIMEIVRRTPMRRVQQYAFG
jgi:peptidoglycan/LPS O-acetylase OafA/YrhL